MMLIKNGRLIDPGQGLSGEYDVLLEGGGVREVGPRGSFADVNPQETIDAADCVVTPGLIDLHVHLREPGFEWKETIQSGSQAAALGGFTTVCCMANTRPVNDSAEITRFIAEKASANSVASRVLPIGAVSKGLEGKELAPLSEIYKAGAVAFSDDGKPIRDAGLMRRALEWSSMLGAPICCHEEIPELVMGGSMNESTLSLRLGLRGMPKAAEEAIIARDIELVRSFGGKAHFCHVSTKRAVELIRRAKSDGIAVTAEVTPHNLVLSEERVVGYDADAKMSPPLREQEDRDALLAGLNDGTIDVVVSDHAPHETDAKQIEFDRAAFGIIGLQTSLPLMLKLVKNGSVSLARLIELWTSAPARVFNLDRCGSLKKGSRADVTIMDMERSWVLTKEVIRSISKNTPFLGETLTGAATTVIRDGRVLVREGRICI